MSKKKIAIKEVIKHTLTSYSDMEGEWNTDCNIDFVLEEPCTFKLFEEEITVDRVKMYIQYWETQLCFANETRWFDCFKVPKNFIHAIYNRILIEQKEGLMKGYSFEDDLMDMLRA